MIQQMAVQAAQSAAQSVGTGVASGASAGAGAGGAGGAGGMGGSGGGAAGAAAGAQMAVLAATVVTAATASIAAGVSVAMQGVFPDVYGWLWPIIFTVLSILFMSMARDVYHLLEIVMRFLVAAMMIAFVGNLFFTGINPIELGKGLIPGSISSLDGSPKERQ